MGIPVETSTRFAEEVESAIEGGILRYTARRRLLARAERLHIGRFDANLLIASVLHARSGTVSAAAIHHPLPRPRSVTTLEKLKFVAGVLIAEAVCISALAWLLL